MKGPLHLAGTAGTIQLLTTTSSLYDNSLMGWSDEQQQMGLPFFVTDSDLTTTSTRSLLASPRILRWKKLDVNTQGFE